MTAVMSGPARPLVPPGCARTPLSRAHFWLHNLGLPLMMASLAAETLGELRAEPLTLNVLRRAGEAVTTP